MKQTVVFSLIFGIQDNWHKHVFVDSRYIKVIEFITDSLVPVDYMGKEELNHTMTYPLTRGIKNWSRHSCTVNSWLKEHLNQTKWYSLIIGIKDNPTIQNRGFFSLNSGVKERLERDEGILQTLKMQRGCELPGFVNSFPVCQSIISYLLEEWNIPAMDYLAEVRNHVEVVLRDMATVTFDKYPNLATRVKVGLI